MMSSVVCDDAIEFLRKMDTESVDLIITDPAYESLEKHRKRGTTTRLKNSKASSNKWFTIFPNARFPQLLVEVYRVLKKNTHFYMFVDQETMFYVKPLAEAVGFTFWKPIVWDKKLIGMGYHYRCRYEFILFFEKGKRKLNDLGVPDVLTHPRINNGYPCEKPVEVVRTLVRQSSDKCDLIVDPFAGSGTTGEAAIRELRAFEGCDICEEAVQVANDRLLLS